jgi:hypothetical protein
MKLDRALLAIVLALLAVIGIALLVPEEPGGRGTTHPEFTTMQRGGSGPERHERILWIGWLFGLLQIALFATLMALGARKAGSPRGAGRPLLLCAAAQAIVWSLLVLAYQDFMQGGDRALHLLFPAPTAILIYGLWPVIVMFPLCFVIGFKRWVLSDGDLAEYERLVDERRRRLRESPGGPTSERPFSEAEF